MIKSPLPPTSRLRRRGYRTAPGRRFGRIFDYLLTVGIIAVAALIAARLDRVATIHRAGNPIVNDGDSLTLAGERIRLRGIDAPELAQTCVRYGGEYPCGRASREALARMVAGRAVSCSGWERDRYDRLLARCVIGGMDLGRAQVEAGWAVAYGDYREAENTARARGAGLWAGSFDRPRDWRAHRGDAGDGEHDLFAQIMNWLREMFRIS